MLLRKCAALLAAAAGLLVPGSAIQLDVSDPQSINDATSTLIQNAMAFYDKNTGLFAKPTYYWWQMGAFHGLLIQRWSITGNDSMNQFITDGIQAQVGEAKNFEPEEQAKELGNDDQLFWALTVLDAAELGFPDPPADKPSWLGLAQAVFNRQTAEWDSALCGGGMRWQKVAWNAGYDYKNTPANGGYFHIAARLARYTGNETYVHYANRMWDWLESSVMWHIDEDGELDLFDGVHVENCSLPNEGQWTYNVGQLLHGAAYLYDMSNGTVKDTWKQRIDLLMKATDRWFYLPTGEGVKDKIPKWGGAIMGEAACEFLTPQKCNQDQPAFKGFLSRWMAVTARFAPWHNETIHARLMAGAKAAAKQCTGTVQDQTPGTSCGRRWYQEVWDGYSGVGEQMAAANAFQSLLMNQAPMPKTAIKGGTSKNDPGLGTEDEYFYDFGHEKVYPTDVAGAIMMTVVFGVFAVTGSVWMAVD